MNRLVKKIFSLLITTVILAGLSITAFAEDSGKMADLKKLDITDMKDIFEENDNIELKVGNIQNSEEIITRGYPGEGPAKPVSSVKIFDYGILKVPGHEGNVGVVVQVMGLGRDRATYDERTVTHYDFSSIILYGTTVDGWYYYYDCGKPTLGTHDFEVIVRSTNSPYNELGASLQLIIGLQNQK